MIDVVVSAGGILFCLLFGAGGAILVANHGYWPMRPRVAVVLCATGVAVFLVVHLGWYWLVGPNRWTFSLFSPKGLLFLWPMLGALGAFGWMWGRGLDWD